MIAVVDGFLKLGEFKIHEKWQHATLNFSIGTREYKFISVYAPSEGETSRSLIYFKNLFEMETIDPEKKNIIAGDWNLLQRLSELC